MAHSPPAPLPLTVCAPPSPKNYISQDPSGDQMQAHNLGVTNEMRARGTPARRSQHSRRKLHLLTSAELQMSGFPERVVLQRPGAASSGPSAGGSNSSGVCARKLPRCGWALSSVRCWPRLHGFWPSNYQSGAQGIVITIGIIIIILLLKLARVNPGCK